MGDAGKTNLVTGNFSLAQNNGILSSVNREITQYINLEYLSIILNKELPKLAKGEGKQKSLLKQDIEALSIEIPVDSNQNPDIKQQLILVKKYNAIQKQRQSLIFDMNYLKNISIDIETEQRKISYIKIATIFDLSIPTNNSKFTKSFIRDNPGNIPVYGASKNVEEVGYGYVEDNLKDVKYFENCLTYNIDASAGYVFYRKNRFSLSEKVRPLIIKKQFIGKLYEPYLEYIIQPIFRANIRGRRGPNGENEFTKINKTIISDLEIPIPVDGNGECNLQAQIEIANKYMKLENIKKQVCNEIDKVLSINLDL